MSRHRPLTLLQVIPELSAGGAERTTVDVAAAVTAAGGRALVASQGGRLEEELRAAGGELVRLPVHSKQLPIMLRNARALAELVRDEGVEVIHVRSRAPAWSVRLAARRTGTPWLATYHGVYRARWPWKRWYNGVMASGDLTIANSAFTRDHLLAQHRVDPARVVTIPRGVDLQRFDPEAVSVARMAAARQALNTANGEALNVLLAGRLTPWKGQSLAIAALARLRADGGPPVRLALAGDAQGRDSYAARLRAEIAAADLRETVTIAGHLEDMPAAYLAADVALSASTEPEAFGRTAVEPQAMARPVLAAAHGAPCETVADGETGWLFPPNDPAALAAALRTAAEARPRRRAAMGEAGRARVRRLYSLEAMTEATLDAYDRLLAERRR